MKLTKQQRQLLIREIITSKRVASQEELSRILRQSNIDVTQATLSRDLREMRILRAPEDDGFRYVLPEVAEGRKIRRVVHEEIVQILSNESIVIIKTLPGRAAGVGVFIDHLRNPIILGTVAGNDTVLVVPASVKKIKEVMAALRMLGETPKEAPAETV